MDDLEYGTRDKRGNWTPNATLEIAPFWIGKWAQLGHFLKDYIWPWNQAQAGKPVQIQRQVPVRESVRCVLVQKPEPRQFPTQLFRRHPDLDSG